MVFHCHIHNGAIVLDEAPPFPEGTPVRVDVVETAHENGQGARRQGGQYAGRIWMAPDFDAPLEEFKEYME